MPISYSSDTTRASWRAFWILAILLMLLWLGGGASRADAAGQVLVRAGSWLVLALAVLFNERLEWQVARPVWWIVLLAVALPALHLIPLPPTIWNALPGHAPLVNSAILSGDFDRWRPLTLSPGGTRNALGSLVVAVAVLLLASRLPRERQWHLAAMLLALVFAGSVLAILQFSGANFDNPLHNELQGQVSGSFANRNHFALFAAMGCALAIVWGLRDEAPSLWKILASFGLVILFVLVVLATGSRSGILLVALAIVLGGLSVRHIIASQVRRLPRKVVIPSSAVIVLLLIVAVGTSVALGRAAGIDRASDLQSGDDLRIQALPTLMSMVSKYFPFGAGLGSFDAAFRIDEPASMLGPLYFNLAHNDLLQVVLEGGLAGLLLLVATLALWGWGSVKAWRGDGTTLSRLGSTLILLTILASITDYPARTPMIMTVTVIASVWLFSHHPPRKHKVSRSTTLPRSAAAL